MSYSVFVGIDWADTCHDVCVTDRSGKIVDQFEVAHSGEALAGLAERFARLAASPQEIAVAIERPHGPVVEILVLRRFHVFHLNPKQLDRLRDRHRVSGAKDDRLDAFVLADSLRNDLHLFRRVQLDDPMIIQLRELSRLDDDLGKEHGRLTNQLREQLRRYYPQLLELVSAADKAWLWDLWELAPDPAAAHALRPGRISKLLRTHRIRKVKPKQVLRALQQPALQVAPGVVPAAQGHIRVLLDQLRVVHTHRRRGEKQMAALLDELGSAAPDDEGTKKEHRDVLIILSLPGVGVRVAATMLAEASQPLGRRDYHDLRRYCGAAPVRIQSGRIKTKGGGRERRGRTVMRRACNPRLREGVYHWARVSAQIEPRANAHYRRLRDKGHTHARALRTIADRNLKMLCAMLTAGELYDPARRSLAA